MMSPWLKRLAAISGLLLTSGALALAQPTLKFEVPFDFATPTTTLTAGRYELSSVHLLSPTPVYRLKNLDTGRAIAVAAPTRILRDEAKAGKAEIVFHCAGETCALAAIFSPYRDGSGVPVRLKAGGDQKELAMIRIPASD